MPRAAATNTMRISITACWSLALLLAFTACSGGDAGDPANRGDFKLSLMTTGQGQIYPYRIRQIDSRGNPTTSIVNIESLETLQKNVNEVNGVLPVATFPESPVLPNGATGNQYVLMSFTHELDLESILSDSLANSVTNSGLTTAIALIAYDPNSESTVTLRGRAFVGGYTYYNESGELRLVQAVRTTSDGGLEIIDGRASGFPSGFNNDGELASAKSFVFIADTDDDLDTIERFDPLELGTLIRIQVTNAVRNSAGLPLQGEVCTATTVGSDESPPEVLGFSSEPVIVPGNGQTGVDPLTSIQVTFNKPVQPGDVGVFLASGTLTPASGGVAITSTVQSRAFSVVYYADPRAHGDLCNYVITPAYNLPGIADITVGVNAQSIRSLSDEVLGRDVSTTFKTGDGPGIVNAPVAPDAVYVGVGGATPGVSVIDLNGYGQGTNGLDPDPVTGEPTKDPSQTNYARNPNIGSPGVLPQLTLGQGPLDAGSNGSLTLVQDTRGRTLLLAPPIVGDVTDIHLGVSLDVVFNNTNVNVNAGGQNHINPATGAPGTGNTIMVIPHPNPPKLVFPPPNLSRGIYGEEPSVASTSNPQGGIAPVNPPCLTSPVNRLVGGSSAGFFPHFIEGIFIGPQPAPDAPPPPALQCPFGSRQQIGHFLYILDRENRQVLVVNSNRFTVMDTIRLSDPVAMSMSPSLGVLAVANFASSTLTFIDTDPRNSTFNTVVAETRVPDGPNKVAWQPDGDAVLAVSREANTLTVVSGGDFSIQTVASGSLVSPIDIAVTERYSTHGNQSGVYYAYVLNENGTIAVFESGPSGVNGIGYDDMIGTVELQFRRATRIKLDYISPLGGVWVAHNDDAGVGKVSRVELTSSPTGPLATGQSGGGFILPPTFRQKTWTVTLGFGGSDPSLAANQRLSGNSPVDVCVDEMLNYGGFPNQITGFNGTRGASIIGHSAKGGVINSGGATPPYAPRFMFIALGDSGRVDVFDLNSAAKVRTLQLPGVKSLSTYWKQ